MPPLTIMQSKWQMSYVGGKAVKINHLTASVIYFKLHGTIEPCCGMIKFLQTTGHFIVCWTHSLGGKWFFVLKPIFIPSPFMSARLFCICVRIPQDCSLQCVSWGDHKNTVWLCNAVSQTNWATWLMSRRMCWPYRLTTQYSLFPV